MALEPESAALFVAEIITPVPLLKENVVLPHTWFASESAVNFFFLSKMLLKTTYELTQSSVGVCLNNYTCLLLSMWFDVSRSHVFFHIPHASKLGSFHAP